MTEDEYREARHDILMRLFSRPELTGMPINHQSGYSKVEDVALQLVELEQVYLRLQEDLDIPPGSLYNNGTPEPENNERRTYQMFSVMEARRKVLNLSQNELARQIGCSQPEISMMENGYQEIPDRLIVPLSEILQVTPEELRMTYEDYLLKNTKKGE
jgi:DNA-binding XRE family transcriptional regulator